RGHPPGRERVRLDRPAPPPRSPRRRGPDPDDDRAPEADAGRVRRGPRPAGVHLAGVRGRGRRHRRPRHAGAGRVPRLPRRDQALCGKIGPAPADVIVGVKRETCDDRDQEPRVTPRGRLFRKYVIVFAGLVSGALLTSGAIELYFSYYEN